MKQRNGFAAFPILILLTVLAVGAAGYVMFFAENLPDQIACTQEAKICPDGSAVGRTGPNCEFAACPGEGEKVATDIIYGEEATKLCGMQPPVICQSDHRLGCRRLDKQWNCYLVDAVINTSDWQTYRNEEYGYQIQFPSDVILETYGWVGAGSGVVKKIPLDAPNVIIGINIGSGRAYVKLCNDCGGWGLGIYNKKFQESIVMNGVLYVASGFIQSTEEVTSKIMAIADNLSETRRINIEYGFSSEYREPFNQEQIDMANSFTSQILSTFRFLDSPPSTTTPTTDTTITTANWLSYINSKYLFGFKYPEGHVPYIAVDKENGFLLPAGVSADRLTLAEDEAQIFSGSTGLTTSGTPKTLEFNMIQEDISAEEWLAGNLQRYIASSHFVSQKNITFAGKKAIEVLGDGTGGSAYKLIVVKPGNFSIAIAQSAKSEFLDAVLKTFTFDVQSLR